MAGEVRPFGWLRGLRHVVYVVEVLVAGRDVEGGVGEVEGEVEEEGTVLVPVVLKEVQGLVCEPGLGVFARGDGARDALVAPDGLAGAERAALGFEGGEGVRELVAHLDRAGLDAPGLVGVAHGADLEAAPGGFGLDVRD